MNKPSIIRSLEWNLEWVKGQKGKPSAIGTPWRAQDIVVGSIQAINECGRSIRRWLDRRPERTRVLRDIRERYNAQQGNKILRDLITLAISEVGACSWVSDFRVGPLPLQREPKPMTDEHRKAAAEGRRQAREAERREQEAARKARFEKGMD